MKMERMEIRHSTILSWLLSPNETHGLSDKFLKAFLGAALINTLPRVVFVDGFGVGLGVRLGVGLGVELGV